jgi:hypothetical protein
MRIALVDIQGFTVDGWFVPKELSIEIGFKHCHYIFKPPQPFATLSNQDKKTAVYLEKNVHGLRYSNGDVKYSKINKILESKLLYAADYIYVRGEQQAEFLRYKCYMLDVCPIIIDVCKFDDSPYSTGGFAPHEYNCHATGLFSCSSINVDHLRQWLCNKILPI